MGAAWLPLFVYRPLNKGTRTIVLVSPLCGDNHEGDGYHGDGDAEEDVVGEGFAKDKGAHEDGSYGFEDSQH